MFEGFTASVISRLTIAKLAVYQKCHSRNLEREALVEPFGTDTLKLYSSRLLTATESPSDTWRFVDRCLVVLVNCVEIQQAYALRACMLKLRCPQPFHLNTIRPLWVLDEQLIGPELQDSSTMELRNGEATVTYLRLYTSENLVHVIIRIHFASRRRLELAIERFTFGRASLNVEQEVNRGALRTSCIA